MATQINPALARLWLPAGGRQYGYMAPIVVPVESEAENRALDYLEQGLSNSQFGSLAQLSRVPDVEMQSLLERLGGTLRPTKGLGSFLSEDEIANHFHELARIYLTSNEDPADLIRSRHASRIFLDSLGRTGLTLARGLGASFIGSVLSMDNASVSAKDLGNLGYTEMQLGVARVKAANALLDRALVQQHSRLSASMENLDLAILISNDVQGPDGYHTWMRREVPHFSIVFDEAGVQVSPIVLPGITPCLACMELAKIDEDANWIAIAPQLAALERSLEDSAMVLFAASVALNQTLLLLDTGAEALPSLAYRLERTGAVSRFQVAARDCGCRANLS